MPETISRRQIVIALAAGLLVVVGIVAGTGLFDSKSMAVFTPCIPGGTVVVAKQPRAADPHIWGDLVVWAKWIQPADNPLGLEGDIYAYKVSTGRIEEIAVGPTHQSVPRIHEEHLVWREEAFDGSPTRMVLRDLATGTESSFSGAPDFFNVVPRGIHGRTVLFHADARDNTTSGLYAYNFTTRQLIQIPNAVSESNRADIWEHDIVHLVPRGSLDGAFRLALFHLENRTSELLLQSSRQIGRLDFRGSFIGLEREGPTEGYDSDIYVFDLRTRQESPVATGEPGRPVGEWLPRVGQDTVAYMELPPPRLLAYRVSTGERVVLHTGGMDVDFDHWDNRTAFLDYEDDGWQVKLACL